MREALGRAIEPKRADVADEEEPGDREELGDVAEDALVEEIVAAPAAVRTVAPKSSISVTCLGVPAWMKGFLASRESLRPKA